MREREIERERERERKRERVDNLRRHIYVHTFWITILYQVMPVEEENLKRKGRFINHGVEYGLFL